MKSVLRDLRHGLQLLIRSPWFAAAAVVTLALGIGANTAIFSVVNAVLLRPLPFKEADRVVKLWESRIQKGRERNPVSPPNFIDWREQNHAFEELAAYTSWNPNFVGGDGATRLQGVQVSMNMFRLLGVNPIIGRYFTPDDPQSGDERVVVIGYGLWQRQFGSDPHVTNRTMTLNGNSHSIIGIMPRDFQFPPAAERKDVWTPLVFDVDDLNGRATRYLQVVARLKSGVSIDQARDDMQNIAGRLATQYSQTNGGWGVTVVPFYDALVADARPTLLVMLGAAGFVLLIGCANVANLLLARASGRQREVAVRLAMGASRSRIVRQLLTEGVVLAVLGGGLGTLLAVAGSRIIIASAPEGIPRLKEISLDASVLSFSVALSLLTALIFGLFPALQVSKPDLNQILKEAGRSVVGGTGGLRFRSVLVVTEVALAFVLLVGAGLMLRSFVRLVGVDAGFSAHGALTAQLSLPSYKYESPAQQRAFFERLVESVRSLPGVQAAGLVSYLPLGGSNMEWSFSIRGRPSQADDAQFAEYRQISARYFQAMGILLQRGRAFSESDAVGSPPVIVVNDAFVRQYFPNEDPLHKVVGFGRQPEWREIVGVVADVRHFGLASEAKAEAYVPYQQDPWPAMALVVRSDGDPVAMVSALRSCLMAIDADLPLYNVRTMESLVAESVAPRRLAMRLLGIFSGVALVLAAVGVFGVMASSVSQRTHEIAIRAALGARPEAIQRLIVLQAAVLALAGIGVGLVASVLLTRFISILLYDVSATDPMVFAAVASTLTVVLIFASYIPARRATMVDPMTALRRE
jgi:putative ABC transport system permease protein